MGLYRRKDASNPKVWYMRYTDASGKLQRESTGTEVKQLAQLALDKVKAEVWEQKKLGIKERRLFSDAVDLFIKAKANRRTVSEYERQLNWWGVQFKGKHIDEITQSLVIETIQRKKSEDGSSPATVNRYLAALRACLRLAVIKHQWMDRSRLPEFFMEEEPKGRVRWLKPDEVGRLIAALPEHWRDIAGFALATGQRMGNVLGLRWQQVDLVQRTALFDGDEMKNGEDHGIALNDVAVQIVRRQIGRHDEYVFSYRGKPVKRGSYRTWNNALKEAGIEDFRRHDMRHTWASMMVQAGTSDAVMMALGAWKTPKMVRRYAHLNAHSLLPFAQQIDAKLAGALGQVTQSQHSPEEVEAPHHLRSVA
jgi:integrase